MRVELDNIIIPSGGFRDLEFHSLTNRLILSKKTVQPRPSQIVAIRRTRLGRLPGMDPEPQPAAVPPTSAVPVITPTLGDGKSRLGMAPLASLVRKVPKLCDRLNEQIDKALKASQESASAQPLTSDSRIEQKLGLVPALFIVGRDEKAAEILEEAQGWANTHQEVKEKASCKSRIAQTIALVDEERAEAISLEVLEIYDKLENPQLQEGIRDDLLKTMAQVATPRCIEKVSEIVDSIEKKQEKLLAIISVASELSDRFSQHVQRPVTTHVQQDEHPTNLTVEPRSDKRIGSIIDLGKRWLATVEKIGSAIRPHAIGAIAYMLKQFGQGDDELDLALHYCKTDLPTAEERLQFLKVMGDNAIASNDLNMVQKVLEAHKQTQAEAGVAGTTITELELECRLGRTKKTIDIFDQLEKPRLKYPLASEFFKTLSLQGEFERAQQALDQIPFAELKVKALIESSSLLLKDGKKDRAIQVSEQVLDNIGRIQDSSSLFWAMAIIAIASPRYSIPLPTPEMSLTLKEMCVPYPLESLISKPELTHTTEICGIEVRERDLNLHKEERSYHREEVAGYLSKLEFGKPQPFRNMEIVPVFTTTDYGTTEHLTLREALEKESLIVTEVNRGELLESTREERMIERLRVDNNSQDKSLPESWHRECRINLQREITEAMPKLKVANTGEKPVVLFEGEELIGGMRNWVSNTTTLLEGNSETVIPCRIEMPHGVTQSLDKLARFTADQDALWKRGREISTQAKVRSFTSTPTGIYRSQGDELDEYVKAFEYVPGQKGLLTRINGEVTRLDVISHGPTYRTLHHQLVRSHAMNALLREHEMEKREVRVSNDEITAFLGEIRACREKRYRSIGHGWNHQFEGEMVVGSALTSDEKEVVHMNFARTRLR